MSSRADHRRRREQGHKREQEHKQGHRHRHHHGHGVSADADHRYLWAGLSLLLAFMAAEVVAGLAAHSLALLSDAGHMLTDAFSLVLALIAMRVAQHPPRGGYTYGLKRAEILSAQLNGLLLILLAVYFLVEVARRLAEPPQVVGPLVLATALVGIVVNVLVTWLLSRASRANLNVEGAFQHVLSDLYAFVATAVAGLVVWLTGFARVDAIASLVVAALMLMAGYRLLRDAGRILMEAAPAGIDPDQIGARLTQRPCVAEVHDLHVWELTSGYPALSAHVLIHPGGDCHAVRKDLGRVLQEEYGITHTTLEVDHTAEWWVPDAYHCEDAHGPRHVAEPQKPHLHGHVSCRH